MKKRSRLAGACVLILSVLGAGGAAAVEALDGAWDAKLACKGLSGAAKESYKIGADLLITQPNPEVVNFSISNMGSGEGYLLSEMAKPGAGLLGGMSCGLAVGNYFGFTLNAAVKTKEGSDQASLKGAIQIFDQVGGELYACKITAKRTSTTNPNLGACP